MAKRKKYLIIDTETANSLDDPLVYDIGYMVVDKYGRIYDRGQFLVSEIYHGEKEMMRTAYYSEKLPIYENSGLPCLTWARVRRNIVDVMYEHEIETVAGYNMFFDYKSIHTTQRFLTSSKHRYFFPYGTEYLCIWRMAQQTLGKQKSYKAFCEEHGFFTENGRMKTSAEVMYRYLINNPNFIEAHTSLQDCYIEYCIMRMAWRQKKAMDAKLFSD